MPNNRYLSQKLFTGIGEEGQSLLEQSSVLLVGCGALGSINAEYLARSGVGYLQLVDGDQVELPNLHRQFLFDENDAWTGVLKVHAARKRLQEINSEIQVDICDYNLIESNMEALVEDMDLIIDCTDNIVARRLIDQIACQEGIPWIYGGVAGSVGMVKYIAADQGESFSDFLKEESPALTTCRNGVINTVTGMVASIQGTEAIKYLTGNYLDINRNLLYFDLWQNQWDMIKMKNTYS